MEGIFSQLPEWVSEAISFIVGAALGTGVTFFSMRNNVQGSGTITDQRKARAHGDIVGRDKRG